MNLASYLPGKLPFSQTRTVNAKAAVNIKRRPRFFYVLAFFVLWTSAIGLRLFWLQVVRHPYYVEKASKQQYKAVEILPRRGIIYDRNLHELAVSVLADSVFVVPYEITNSKDPAETVRAKQATANALAAVVHTDPDDSFTSAERINARLVASKDYAWVARGLDPSVIAQVKALNLKGVHIQQEYKRFYPDNQIAAQVLGYVGTDATGLGGLEQNFEEDLHGTPGNARNAVDARHHVLGSLQSEPVPGENLILTLDENIQFMAEQALDHAMERTKSINGTVVVQDPHTGQILALAIRPTFNPNDFRHATGDLRRNHAVSDVYEPGSTFKLVTYSAALEEKVTTPDKMIDCHGGQLNVAGRIVHDDHYNGVMTTSQALWVSSDVAAIQLAQRMGPNTFYKYIRSYGFGDRSGLEVPGETRGLLKPVHRWNPTTIGSIPMGQEIAVTPVQLITMASTIANGGIYLPPHILLSSTDQVKGSATLKPTTFHPEDDLPNPLPDGAHRVISTMTAAQMRKMMEGVVLFGTGSNAQLNGYSSAGKTGTAQKIDVATHTYSKSKYIASFVGFAPVNNPAISIAVVMDSPSDGGHHGAQASAPVFHELAQEVLEYLGVPHDIELKSAPAMAKSLTAPAPQEHAQELNESVDQLFGEVNNLPEDDPLRSAKQESVETAGVDSGASPMQQRAPAPSQVGNSETPQVPAPPHASNPPSDVEKARSPNAGSNSGSLAPKAGAGSVIVDSTQRVAVPSFVGQGLRQVVEQAGSSGLEVQVLGTGLAREQSPSPGIMVPAGTKVVVKFTR